MKNDLREFLQQTFTWHAYEKLHQSLRTSKTRITQMLNDPGSMNYGEIIMLAKVIPGQELKGIDLVERFKCGNNCITLAEVEKLRKETS